MGVLGMQMGSFHHPWSIAENSLLSHLIKISSTCYANIINANRVLNMYVVYLKSTGTGFMEILQINYQNFLIVEYSRAWNSIVICLYALEYWVLNIQLSNISTSIVRWVACVESTLSKHDFCKTIPSPQLINNYE